LVLAAAVAHGATGAAAFELRSVRFLPRAGFQRAAVQNSGGAVSLHLLTKLLLTRLPAGKLGFNRVHTLRSTAVQNTPSSRQHFAGCVATKAKILVECASKVTDKNQLKV
jgi:hypothetical protein